MFHFMLLKISSPLSQLNLCIDKRLFSPLYRLPTKQSAHAVTKGFYKHVGATSVNYFLCEETLEPSHTFLVRYLFVISNLSECVGSPH